MDPASTASEVCLMMSEALNLLNNCSPVGDVLSVTLDFILQFIRDSSCTMLVLASIPAACRTLASIQFMVSVVETGIESFFAKHSRPNRSDSQTEADGGWGQVVPSVAVPELALDEFVQGWFLFFFVVLFFAKLSVEREVGRMRLELVYIL